MLFRSWLNGFLVGMLGLDGTTPLSLEQTSAMLGPAGDGDDGEAPWHDPAMPLTERLQLAESRPLRRRMMAAMGQQDCGQCGYNCEDYANAIFLKSEERLNLCVPGGKETARMLKTLYGEFGAIPAAKAPASPPTATSANAKDAPPAAARVEASAQPTATADRKSTRLNSSHEIPSRMPSSA